MSRSDRVTGGKATLLTTALKNANQTLNKSTSTQAEIRVALFPLITSEWDTLVIRKVGSDPLNKFLQNTRNACIPQAGYLQLKNVILNRDRELVDDIPRQWRIWADCIRQFRLCETTTWGELPNMIRLLQLGHFDTPGLLAGATKPRVAAWSGTPEFYGIELIRQCARCFTADANSGPSLPENNPTFDAIRAAGLLKNKTVEAAGYMKRDIELRTFARLPVNFNKLTPTAKTDALRMYGESAHIRNEFLENGGQTEHLADLRGLPPFGCSRYQQLPPVLHYGRLNAAPALFGHGS